MAADWNAVDGLVERAYRRVREVYRPTAAAETNRVEAEQQYERLVAECDRRVVGTLEYRRTVDGLHVRGLAVDPEFQQSGIARALIDELGERARARGGTLLSLYTIRETGNVEIFSRLGFAVVSETLADWCESDRFSALHEVRMERTLAQS